MTMDSSGLQVIEAAAVAAPIQTVEEFERRLEQFREFTKRNLREGVDYGVVPGIAKPTLLKPGAEKVLRWHGLVVDVRILPSSKTDVTGGVLDIDLEGTVRHAATGIVLGTVHANANSEERRYRNARMPDPERPDKTPQTVADQKNTILKMGDKRVWVAAALLYTGASEAYTQDVEDMDVATPDAPRGFCTVHKQPFREIPAGVSKTSGKAYHAFWACPVRGCKERPAEEGSEATPAPAAAANGAPPSEDNSLAVAALLKSLEAAIPKPADRLKAARVWAEGHGVALPNNLDQIASLGADGLTALLDSVKEKAADAGA